MLINIFDIPEEGLVQEFDLPIIIHKKEKPDTASVRIKLLRFGKKVLVEGSVHAAVSLTCSRCLNDYSSPVHLDFREEFTPADEPDSEKDQELSGAEMDVSFYQGEELDISSIVKEQVLLEVPIKPLCNEDCKGMCPQCGVDLNTHSCSCKEDHIDPRLAPLAKYKESLKRRKE